MLARGIHGFLWATRPVFFESMFSSATATPTGVFCRMFPGPLRGILESMNVPGPDTRFVFDRTAGVQDLLSSSNGLLARGSESVLQSRDQRERNNVWPFFSILRQLERRWSLSFQEFAFPGRTS